MVGRRGFWSLFGSVALLVGVAGGCEAILQFDEHKLDGTSTTTAGGGHGPGGGGNATVGGGGNATVGGGGSAGGMTSGGGGSGATGGTGGGTAGSGGSTGGCADPGDCPDTGSECITATCDQNTCGTENVANNMQTSTQTAGDCKLAVCDGSGGITTIDDDTDAFDDGKDCTLDTCNAGMPESMPATVGTSCNDDGGKVCDGAGSCVQCNMDADCAAPNPKCTMHVCVPSSCNDGVKNGGESDTDCGGPCGATCDTGDTCMGAGDCINGICAGTTCAAPLCNDNVKNGSETDKDCGGSCSKCGPNKGCNVNADCAGNQCTGAGGTCVPNCSDGVKNNMETGTDCGGGTCSGCAIGGACGMDTDCASGAYCDVNGACAAKKPNGTACVGNNQCALGNCVDGVCCNTACGGLCQACNIAGSAGTCTNIAAGQDPIDECAGAASVCDGAGACKKSNGQTCGGAAECALGLCVDGYCCNSGCVGTCIACNVAGSLGTCTNIPNGQDPANECAGAINCNGNGGCGSLLGNGSACSVGNECQSGNCIDGYCCNSTCGGLCAACNIAGSLGACSNIPNGQDPGNECANGACNGAGVCKLDNGQSCAAGSACLSTSCVDGVCCDAACSGTCAACNIAGSVGTCSNISNGQDPANECTGAVSCNGAGACGFFSNGTACSLAGECVSGNCVDGVCCNSVCNTVCKACNIAGSVGTCSNIANGQDPAAECSGAVTCNGAGACGFFSNGAACSSGAECSSGNCVDGVCCGSASCGTCQSCNIAGSAGTCTNIALGQTDNNPVGTCTGNNSCNGAGACKKNNGQACALNTDCVSALCVDGVCCNTSCGATCQACNLAGSVGTCTNIPNGQDPSGECFGATNCNGAGSCALLGNGTACSQGTECSSGNCVDGVCCNTGCSSTCLACNLAGSVGTCTNIPNGQDPSNECTGATTCNGAGACVLLGQGSSCSLAGECSTGFCVDGYCCNSSCIGTCKSCDGAYNITGNGTCGNIDCADPDGNCSGGKLCSGGICTLNCL